MALKDWKSTGENEWHKFVEGKKPFSEESIIDGVMITKTINGDWTFGSYYRQIPKEYQYKQGRLKTKEQAIKLANKYIRTH